MICTSYKSILCCLIAYFPWVFTPPDQLGRHETTTIDIPKFPKDFSIVSKWVTSEKHTLASFIAFKVYSLLLLPLIPVFSPDIAMILNPPLIDFIMSGDMHIRLQRFTF